MDLNELNMIEVVDGLEKDMRKDYDALCLAIRKNNSSGIKLEDGILVGVIKQFRLVVVRLNHGHVQLVNEVLKVEWTTGSDELSKEFQAFVLDLLSVHLTLYIHGCLKVAIKNFVSEGIADQTLQYSEISDEARTRCEIASQRVHELLQKIVKVFPSATMFLDSIFSSSCPLQTKLLSQEIYVKNLLKVTEYLPRMTSNILTLVMRSMILLDTETTKEEAMKYEDGIKLEQTNANAENVVEPAAMKSKIDHVKTLDCLMLIVFKYIKDQHFKDGELQWTELKKFYLEFRKIFNLLLMRTIRTYHVQFLMFYVCSLKIDLAVDFLEFLWTQVTSLNMCSIQRQLAAAYLGSFLSRAKYLPLKLVNCQLTLMKEWIHKYMENCSNPFKSSFDHNCIFYLVCQSFFYTIVFRHRQIIDTPQGRKFCLSLHLQKIVTSHLNPLRFCHQPIAETFCAVVRNNQIAFCDNVLEKNRRQAIALNEDRVENLLLSFFPFDPYHLPRSKNIIESSYLEYDNSILKFEIKQETLAEEMDYMEFEEKDSFRQVSREIDMELSPKIKNFSLYSTSPGFQR